MTSFDRAKVSVAQNTLSMPNSGNTGTFCYSRNKLAVAARNCRFWEFSQRVSGQLLCSIGILRKDLLHARFQGKFKCLLAILEFDQLVIMANWVKGWIVRTQLPGRKSLSGRPSARGQDVSRWRVPTLDPGPRPQRRLAVLPRLCATAGALRTCAGCGPRPEEAPFSPPA